MAVTSTRNGLTVTAHVGERAVLLAMDLPQEQTKDLAGFAIQCTVASATPPQTFWLKNLLSWSYPVTATTKDAQHAYTDSNAAPFQLFHWTHYVQEDRGTFTYTVSAVYFTGSTDAAGNPAIQLSPTVSTSVTVRVGLAYQNCSVGLTRGYMSSQAYLNKFGADPSLRPATDDGLLFDTKPFQGKYAWLGWHARDLIESFIQRCVTDTTTHLDVFAYDFDEPDIVRAIGQVGHRARLLLDDSVSKKDGKTSGHGADGSPETAAATYLEVEARGVTLKRLHFARFQHNKVLIRSRNGVAEAVLTGSTNFSIRGLYVHSNHVLELEDPTIASWYQQAFNQAWTNARQFKSSAIASDWESHDGVDGVLPSLRISFAPHSDQTTPQEPFSITTIAQAVDAAGSSVLFAIMEPTGGGTALEAITSLGNRAGLLSLGTVDKKAGVQAFRPGWSSSVVPFAALAGRVPEPFRSELTGGQGQHIHHKFVVIDFNTPNAKVYCGSSNLAKGGEESNADNLLEIADGAIATAFAVEAIGLFDHYRFRSKQQEATSDDPLVLDKTDAWVGNGHFYDDSDVRSLERTVLVQPQATTPAKVPVKVATKKAQARKAAKRTTAKKSRSTAPRKKP